MTRVYFFNIPANKYFNGEVLAYFPDEIADLKNNRVSYAHIGQHSACSPDYVADAKLASPEEYKDLLRELVGQGYDDLQIMNIVESEYHKAPTAWENKFGEGATHYKTYTLWEIAKPGGKFPKWLKDKNDGLRYYY